MDTRSTRDDTRARAGRSTCSGAAGPRCASTAMTRDELVQSLEDVESSLRSAGAQVPFSARPKAERDRFVVVRQRLSVLIGDDTGAILSTAETVVALAARLAAMAAV